MKGSWQGAREGARSTAYQATWAGWVAESGGSGLRTVEEWCSAGPVHWCMLLMAILPHAWWQWLHADNWSQGKCCCCCAHGLGCVGCSPPKEHSWLRVIGSLCVRVTVLAAVLVGGSTPACLHVCWSEAQPMVERPPAAASVQFWAAGLPCRAQFGVGI